MIVKRGNRWAVVHCHGKKKGKTIKSYRSRGAALRLHRAIEANKHKKSKR